MFRIRSNLPRNAKCEATIFGATQNERTTFPFSSVMMARNREQPNENKKCKMTNYNRRKITDPPHSNWCVRFYCMRYFSVAHSLRDSFFSCARAIANRWCRIDDSRQVCWVLVVCFAFCVVDKLDEILSPAADYRCGKSLPQTKGANNYETKYVA